MTQSNLRTMIGFTLFGALMGSFISSVGFWMWIVSESVGLVVGVVFFALSAFLLSRKFVFSPVLGLGGGLFVGALIGALIGLAFNAARVSLEIPPGVIGALVGGALSLIAWGILGLAFGDADPQKSFQPRFSFAIALLFAWIVGFGGALFYPLFAGILDAVGFGTIAGGVAGTFLGSAMAMELQKRESKRPKKR
ncbi:MAG: hypothetical protein L0Y55_15685 [Anaerolineales bacterium]|nr:hypothetical protein [Anaerolineales bacterium]